MPSRSLTESLRQAKGDLTVALQALGDLRNEVATAENKLKDKREARNNLALDLIDNGSVSLRKIADVAGVSNPYLVELRKKRANGNEQ